MTHDDTNHAIANAKAWLESIEEMLDAEWKAAAEADGWTGPHKDKFGATYFEQIEDGERVTWGVRQADRNMPSALPRRIPRRTGWPRSSHTCAANCGTGTTRLRSCSKAANLTHSATSLTAYAEKRNGRDCRPCRPYHHADRQRPRGPEDHAR